MSLSLISYKGTSCALKYFPRPVEWQQLTLYKHTGSNQKTHSPTGRPPGSNLPWGDLVYCLAPEASNFREMPTGPEVFLEALGMSGQQPCAQTHQKWPCCHTRPVWGIRQIPTRSPRLRLGTLFKV